MASKASDLKALAARLVVIVNHLQQLELQIRTLVESQIVKTQAFLLRSGRGEIRARLNITEYSPRLTFCDRLGETLLHVGLRPDGTPDQSDFKKGMRRCGAMVFITLLLSGSAVYADTALASHKCTAPMKQREFATQAQLERYKSAVELYRSCLEAFVKEQETAVETHRQAAQNAIGDWNRFVGQETREPPRAPEDKRDSQEFRSKP